jgi:uncharacterized metal-binding protein YceD (DUF177 family)
MNAPRFIVRVPDLESGPQHLATPITKDWMDAILEDTEVRGAGPAGEAKITVTKNGPQILVQGHLSVTVEVPCARTLDPAVYNLRPEVFLMLEPDRSRGAHSGRHSRRHDRSEKEPGGKKKGEGGWAADPELSGEDAATDTYSGEEVILDTFFREFILLEIPMVPLREDLRDGSSLATPPLPGGPGAATLDRPEASGHPLSPLAALKARLEKKE